LAFWRHFRLLGESIESSQKIVDSRSISSRVKRLISSIWVELECWYRNLTRRLVYIRATNYFASLFINICYFNNTFLANNREINANKIVIYLQKIILFVIEENVLVFKSCFFLCLIFYNLLITNKRIESFNKIENLKTFNNINSASLVSKTYINYLELILYVRINCLAKWL